MDTNSFSYTQSLVEAGLTQDQALTYEILIQNGPMQASRIHRKSTLSRPLIYKVLGDLEGLGLVEKDENNSPVATFKAAHPLKLKEILDRRFEAAQHAKSAMEGAISKLISDFNLVSGKPGIRFYEGKEGVREVINDALTSKTEIYSYVDIETIEREIPEISRDFAKARIKLGLKKRNIGIDTPENRKAIEDYFTEVTEERLIPWKSPSFGTVMQIYDNKVSYLTLGEQMIGVIIADPHIFEMHKALFEFTWSSPQTYRSLSSKQA